jgi:hypothetical protein
MSYADHRRRPNHAVPLFRTVSRKILGTGARFSPGEGTDPRQVWESLDDDARRKVIDALMIVRIAPARTKEQAYLDWRARVANPETVKIAPRVRIRSRKFWTPGLRADPGLRAASPHSFSIPISASTHRVTEVTGNRKDTPDDHENKPQPRQKAHLQQIGQDEQEQAIHNHGFLHRRP